MSEKGSKKIEIVVDEELVQRAKELGMSIYDLLRATAEDLEDTVVVMLGKDRDSFHINTERDLEDWEKIRVLLKSIGYKEVKIIRDSITQRIKWLVFQFRYDEWFPVFDIKIYKEKQEFTKLSVDVIFPDMERFTENFDLHKAMWLMHQANGIEYVIRTIGAGWNDLVDWLGEHDFSYFGYTPTGQLQFNKVVDPEDALTTLSLVESFRKNLLRGMRLLARKKKRMKQPASHLKEEDLLPSITKFLQIVEKDWRRYKILLGARMEKGPEYRGGLSPVDLTDFLEGVNDKKESPKEKDEKKSEDWEIRRLII